jgi:hypothetical protein
MSKPSVIARSALAGAAALSASLAAPQMAAAQAYGYGQPAYGDVCRSDRNNRTALGALLGAGAGAVLGSQIAANHHRTDGSIVGGLLGAFGGGALGHNTAPCQPEQAYAPPPPPAPVPAYAAPPPPPPPPPRAEYDRPDGYYQGRFDDDHHDDDDRNDDNRHDDDHWAYGPRGQRFRIADRPVGPDGCTLAESPIYMPDGRVQKRFVRVCMDSSGRYQVVD